jgi:hypothetical protein
MVVVLALSGTADAQPPAAKAESRINPLASFARTAPQVGDRLPELPLFDAGGKPFSLGNLKGNYSVLVCGCLT